MYNGQVAKGILMLIGCVLLWLVALGWIINLWSIADAYINARNMNLKISKAIGRGRRHMTQIIVQRGVRCPHCATFTPIGTAQCANCGMFMGPRRALRLAPLEAALRLALGKGSHALAVEDVALLLAWIPLLMVPPAVALFLFASNYVVDAATARKPRWRTALLVASVNLAISLLVWQSLSSHVVQVFEDILRMPAAPQRPTTTPI